MYHPNHQRTHDDTILDIPFLVPTAPIKGIWYLDKSGSTVGTNNASPTPVMVGTQTVKKEIAVEEWNKDHAWPTASVAETPDSN